MKDSRGFELAIGDVAAYSGSYGSEIGWGTVQGFTEKKIRIKRDGSTYIDTKFPVQVCKITAPSFAAKHISAVNIDDILKDRLNVDGEYIANILLKDVSETQSRCVHVKIKGGKVTSSTESKGTEVLKEKIIDNVASRMIILHTL